MKLIECLQKDFPEIIFEPGKENLWFPDNKKIVFCPDDNVGLLHELGHALCGHSEFSQDIELLHAERDAWDKAINLGKKYKISIDEDRIETSLDWYRDWLHSRSTCPKCNQNGVQDKKSLAYTCLNCNSSWKANDSRKVSLRRYKNTPN